MKKIFTLAALALAATLASAGTVGFTTYDYDRYTGSGPWNSQHEVQVGVATTTKLGTFDGSVVVGQLVTSVRDDTLGFELGYSNGIKLGAVALKGRVSYGVKNQVNISFPGYDGNSEYYGLAAEAGLPLSPTVTAFGGYRYRAGFGSDPLNQNRYTIGADFKVAPNVALRAGYAYTNQNGVGFNGLTTAIVYGF